MIYEIFRIKKFLELSKAKRNYKKWKITVIHTHHRMAAMYAQILRIHFKCKVFCSIHGEFYDKKWFTKIAYRNCKLIACGNAVKTIWLMNLVLMAKIFLFYKMQ